MIDKFILGQSVTVSAAFTHPVTDAPLDPTTLTLVVESPSGVETTYVYGVDLIIVRDSEGLFHADLLPGEQGKWVYRFVGTGSAAGANEGEFLIASGIDDTLDILIGPSDFDSVRALLGVEIVDLENDIILLSIYGPAIEARVKGMVLDWVTVMATPDTECAMLLRAAVAFGVAAQLAESYMKGGTVSLVHTEQPRRNWSEWARIFWKRYDEYVARSQSCIAGVSTDYDMPSVLLGGPTRSRGTRPDWTGYYPPVWPDHSDS